MSAVSERSGTLPTPDAGAGPPAETGPPGPWPPGIKPPGTGPPGFALPDITPPGIALPDIAPPGIALPGIGPPGIGPEPGAGGRGWARGMAECGCVYGPCGVAGDAGCAYCTG